MGAALGKSAAPEKARRDEPENQHIAGDLGQHGVHRSGSHQRHEGKQGRGVEEQELRRGGEVPSRDVGGGGREADTEKS